MYISFHVSKYPIHSIHHYQLNIELFIVENGFIDICSDLGTLAQRIHSLDGRNTSFDQRPNGRPMSIPLGVHGIKSLINRPASKALPVKHESEASLFWKVAWTTSISELSLMYNSPSEYLLNQRVCIIMQNRRFYINLQPLPIHFLRESSQTLDNIKAQCHIIIM